MIIVLHVKLNSPQSAILVSIIARMGVWVLDNHCAIIPPAFALESGLCLKKSGKCRRSKNRESKPWPGQPGSKVYANRSHSCISRLDSCNPPTLVPEVPSFLFVNHILAAFAPVENRKTLGPGYRSLFIWFLSLLPLPGVRISFLILFIIRHTTYIARMQRPKNDLEREW